MARKTIKFAINAIILEGHSNFTHEAFSGIEQEIIDPQIINKGSSDAETLSVKIIQKEIVGDRYVAFYFLMGDKYPYPKKVVSENLSEKDNPRPPNEIELEDQLFVLIDCKFARIYTSDQRRKNWISQWLSENLDLNVSVKAIFNEKEFVEKVKTVNRISFTVTPNLLSSTSNYLSGHLVQDIYGFGADKAQLILDYKQTRITDTIREKLNSLLQKRNEFQEITVVGMDDSEIETILNLEEVTNNISIDVIPENESKLLNSNEVFTSLISKIEE